MKIDGVIYLDDMVLAHIICDPNAERVSIPVMRIKPEHLQSWIDGEKPFHSEHLSARVFQNGKEYVIQ